MVDETVIAKVARLSRIAVKEEEKGHFAREISGILQWVEQLNAVDTSGIAPMASVSDVKLPWRADLVTDGGQQQAVLKGAPKQEYGCFAVPKVIE